MVAEEILDFWGAATLTSQFTTTATLVACFQHPEVLEKIRKEFKTTTTKGTVDYTELSDDKIEFLSQVLKLDTVNDFEYLTMAINEAMRIEGPTVSGTHYWMDRDIKVGKINLRKGDSFFVNFHALHKNANQWQKPFEYIPERFDHSDPISKTPDGKTRIPASFCPFNGGSRICFGKTFAEASMKILISYFTQVYDFEFVNPEYKTKFPNGHFGINKHNKIEVVLTNKKKSTKRTL